MLSCNSNSSWDAACTTAFATLCGRAKSIVIVDATNMTDIDRHAIDSAPSLLAYLFPNYYATTVLSGSEKGQENDD